MTLIDRAIGDLENTIVRLRSLALEQEKLVAEVTKEIRYLKVLRDEIRTDVAAVTVGGVSEGQ